MMVNADMVNAKTRVSNTRFFVEFSPFLADFCTSKTLLNIRGYLKLTKARPAAVLVATAAKKKTNENNNIAHSRALRLLKTFLLNYFKIEKPLPRAAPKAK